jgi:anti-sigma factor RsiW
MTDHRHTIRDIDLMAYADGLLDADPQRKAEVESYLREHPEKAARVRAYAAQNDVIRRLYNPVLAEPIPERLWGALESRREGVLKPVARAAIAACLILAAGFTGWIIGQRGRVDHWPMQAFVKQTMMAYDRPALVSSSGAESALDQANEKTDQPLDWLFHQIAVPLKPPDLSAEGFTLVDKRLVSGNGPRVAQVTYAASGGRRLSLFLRTRWEDEVPQFRFVENDGVTMVHWLEGAMVYALVGQIDRQEMVHVVQTLRTSMRQQSRDAQPQMDTTTMPEVQPIAPAATPLRDTLLAPHVTPTQPVRSKYP